VLFLKFVEVPKKGVPDHRFDDLRRCLASKVHLLRISCIHSCFKMLGL